MGLPVEDQRAKKDWRWEIVYLVGTLGPWLVLVWLLWPHHWSR